MAHARGRVVAREDADDTLVRLDTDDTSVCLMYSWRHAMIKAGVDTPPWPAALLRVWTGESEEVCEAAIERAADRDLIKYGVSLRSGWLTEAGRALADGDTTICFTFPLESTE